MNAAADPGSLLFTINVHGSADKTHASKAPGVGAGGSGGASAPPFHSAAPAPTTHRADAAAMHLHVPPHPRDYASAVLDMSTHQHPCHDTTPPSAPIDSLHKIATILPSGAQDRRTVGGHGAGLVGTDSGGGGGGGGGGGDPCGVGGADQEIPDLRYSFDQADLDFFAPRDSDGTYLRWSLDSARNSLEEHDDAQRDCCDHVELPPVSSDSRYDPDAGSAAAAAAALDGYDATATTAAQKIVDGIKTFGQFIENTNQDCATLLLKHENQLSGILDTSPNYASAFVSS